MSHRIRAMHGGDVEELQMRRGICGGCREQEAAVITCIVRESAGRKRTLVVGVLGREEGV